MHAASDGPYDVVTHWIRIRKVIVDRRAAIESIAVRRSRNYDEWVAATQLTLPCAIDALPNRLRLLENDLRVFQRPA